MIPSILTGKYRIRNESEKRRVFIITYLANLINCLENTIQVLLKRKFLIKNWLKHALISKLKFIMGWI